MSIYFSFVVPCYNEEDWLPRLLVSLNECETSFEIIEFIIVDNGSTDRTIHVLWELIPTLKYRVKLVHELRKGVSLAKNTGALSASGEVLIFVDADNILTQKFIEDLLSTSREEDFCGATVRVLAESGSIKGSIVFYILEIIKLIFPRPFGKSVARREAFFAIGGFDEKVKLGENVFFTSNLKYFASNTHKKFLHIKSPIYASLRRFQKIGYLKILFPWLIAYLGARRLPYETVDKL